MSALPRGAGLARALPLRRAGGVLLRHFLPLAERKREYRGASISALTPRRQGSSAAVGVDAGGLLSASSVRQANGGMRALVTAECAISC